MTRIFKKQGADCCPQPHEKNWKDTKTIYTGKVRYHFGFSLPNLTMTNTMCRARVATSVSIIVVHMEYT